MGDRAFDIEWDYLAGGDDPAIAPGELVSAAAGGLPIYRVMSLADGRAWLRDIRDGADRVTPLAAFHWRARSGAGV